MVWVLDELRRGWYLGDDDFRDRVVGAIFGSLRALRKRGSVAGPAGRAHDEAEVERLSVQALAELRIDDSPCVLKGRGRLAGALGGGAWRRRVGGCGWRSIESFRI